MSEKSAAGKRVSRVLDCRIALAFEIQRCGNSKTVARRE
jgi:hypothetical protein